jgi:hypothetical protein
MSKNRMSKTALLTKFFVTIFYFYRDNLNDKNIFYYCNFFIKTLKLFLCKIKWQHLATKKRAKRAVNFSYVNCVIINAVKNIISTDICHPLNILSNKKASKRSKTSNQKYIAVKIAEKNIVIELV